MASGIRKRETKGTSHHPNKVKTEIYCCNSNTNTRWNDPSNASLIYLLIIYMHLVIGMKRRELAPSKSYLTWSKLSRSGRRRKMTNHAPKEKTIKLLIQPLLRVNTQTVTYFIWYCDIGYFLKYYLFKNILK
jgi:hypothetical protein